MRENPQCLACGSRKGRFVTGADIWPHRPDLRSRRVYRCQCGATVGCHANSGVPFGRPADRRIREARQAAHAVFDPLWQSGPAKSRTSAYQWLAKQMGMTVKECHIGDMGEKDALRVVAICSIFS